MKAPAASRLRRVAPTLIAALGLLVFVPGAGAAPSGTFIKTFGNGVDAPAGGGFETCTVAANCVAGPFGGSLGGEFYNPTGIGFDSAGNLYVADTASARIEKLDPSQGFLRAWGKDVDQAGGTGFEQCSVAASCKAGVASGSGGEVDQPSGIAVNPTSGDIYVADYGNNRISEFDSAGNFLRTWGNDVDTGGGGGFEICTVAPSCQFGTAGGLGGEMSFPSGIALDGAGNVYITEAGGQRVQKFDSTGNFLAAWGQDVDTGGGPGFEVCTNPASCQAGTSGGIAGSFNGPRGIDVSPSGQVFVADGFNQRIQEFTTSGTFVRMWGKDVDSGGGTGVEVCTVAINCQAGTPGSQGGEMNFPSAVATNAAGDIFVTDQSNFRVQEFASSLAFDRAWGDDVDSAAGNGFEVCKVSSSCQAGAPSGGGGAMNGPQGITVGPSGDIFVADTVDNRIQEFGGGQPPAAPTLTGTSPASPADDNSPEILGSAAATTTVRIYANASCTGAPLATGSSAALASPGITVSVADNTTTTFHASATDGDGNTSACSAGAQYTESTPDSRPPALIPDNGKTVVASLVSGTVKVKDPGKSKHFRILLDGEEIPVGSHVDATKGRVNISTEDVDGTIQSADFYAGAFQVLQPNRTTLVQLVLEGGNFKPCKAKRSPKRASWLRLPVRSSYTAQRLWGSGKGHFQTKGHHGSGTVRGTKWYTADRCDGTFFKVAHGVVAVRDFARRKTVTLTAGKSYLARAR